MTTLRSTNLPDVKFLGLVGQGVKLHFEVDAADTPEHYGIQDNVMPKCFPCIPPYKYYLPKMEPKIFLIIKVEGTCAVFVIENDNLQSLQALWRMFEQKASLLAIRIGYVEMAIVPDAENN